jgi:hypothetical protein
MLGNGVQTIHLIAKHIARDSYAPIDTRPGKPAGYVDDDDDEVLLRSASYSENEVGLGRI